MTLDRRQPLADDRLAGSAWCERHADLVDQWLAGLFEQVAGDRTDGVALVAVGGYGRSELCPRSDLDIMLVHHRGSDVSWVADAIWYPIWDAGVRLGHSVCTPREALELAAEDLDTATALLSARLVSGDVALFAELAAAARSQWRKRSRRRLTELAESMELRHDKAGELAFRLEPDLKEGKGGLRDVHALGWAEAAQPILLDYDAAGLASAYSVLLDARVELHRRTGRATNVLSCQEQEAVAAALGQPDADALVTRISEAGRAIAWTSDDAWRRIRSSWRAPPIRFSRRGRLVARGVRLLDGEVVLDDGDAPLDTAASPPTEDPVLALRVAAAAARHDSAIERHSLERLAATASALPTPWPDEARSLLVELLAQGRTAIPVIEALDQRGVWIKVLPEWQSVRSRPQHNPYHRFTVDRHLLETAANAAELADRVDRADLLMVASLLHDLGKGHPGDHTDTGVALVREIGTRMGYVPDDVATLVALVRHHLLLADVGIRRDLDDPDTIEQVAVAIGSISRLQLLAALTEADSLATGASAWGPWKARLVGQLVERVTARLGGGRAPGAPGVACAPGAVGVGVGVGVGEHFPTARQLARLAEDSHVIEGRDNVLTVMVADRPGIFSRVAGVLALHGLDVIKASAYSSEGRALAEFYVTAALRDNIFWPPVVADLELGLEGRLAVNARLTDRTRTYRRSRPSAGRREAASVTFDNDVSATATVIDVRAHDHIGVLYRITRALADLDLDIPSARAQTLGTQVVDSFYVRDRHGAKVVDGPQLAEVERAILHSVGDDATI